MTQIHWSVYAAIATIGTGAIGLMIASDMKGEPTMGHWGLLAAMLACVISCAVICDRFARRMLEAIEQAAECHARRNEALMRSLAGDVVEGANKGTREVAEEASRGIMRAVNGDPTRIH